VKTGYRLSETLYLGASCTDSKKGGVPPGWGAILPEMTGGEGKKSWSLLLTLSTPTSAALQLIKAPAATDASKPDT
jgi:hypothetical protein